DEINDLLEKEEVTARFISRPGRTPSIEVQVTPIDELESHSEEHVNIRVLVDRMDTCLAKNDFSGTVHACGSALETLAKDIVGTASVQNQTLGGFFERYKRDSNLSEEILNYVLSIYDLRSTTPLAAHGNTATPTITKQDAILMAEFTKAIILAEYKLRH
ncbi:hypothetical protein KKH18_05350, partial [bacterium]|nr:hypothetical protein [bacterium]